MIDQVRSRLNHMPRRPPQSSDREEVLILTPLKDAASSLDTYLNLLQSLTYPHEHISIGMLESDSSDGTYDLARRMVPILSREFGGARLWKHDYGFHIPPGLHRGDGRIQHDRRAVLARSRNQLLVRALQDQAWVLWLDVDLIAYPPDIIERLLLTEKSIVQPHCVLDYGGPTFDQNGWRDHGRYHLDDFRGGPRLVPLDAVGGTMLLVRADLHRDGLIFPSVPYRAGHPKSRGGEGELETEGLGILASDMGETCWGIPDLEILHRRA